MEYDEKKFKENTLVTVLMTVIGNDGQMFKVDNIEIKAIKSTPSSLTPPLFPTSQTEKHPIFSKINVPTQLSLHSITLIPASPDAPDAKCENILCRVFTKILTGANKAKATAKGAVHKIKCFCMKCIHALTGHKHHHYKGGKHPHPHPKEGKYPAAGVPHHRPDGTLELPSHIHFQPNIGGHKFHPHHHHKGFFSRVAMVLKTTVKDVFIPILIGVAFGMAASAIGMRVRQAVIFLWMRFRGQKGAKYQRLETDEKDEPPKYKDLAVAEGVEVVSEKEVEVKA